MSALWHWTMARGWGGSAVWHPVWMPRARDVSDELCAERRERYGADHVYGFVAAGVTVARAIEYLVARHAFDGLPRSEAEVAAMFSQRPDDPRRAVRTDEVERQPRRSYAEPTKGGCPVLAGLLPVAATDAEADARDESRALAAGLTPADVRHARYRSQYAARGAAPFEATYRAAPPSRKSRRKHARWAARLKTEIVRRLGWDPRVQWGRRSA